MPASDAATGDPHFGPLGGATPMAYRNSVVPFPRSSTLSALGSTTPGLLCAEWSDQLTWAMSYWPLGLSDVNPAPDSRSVCIGRGTSETTQLIAEWQNA